MAGNGRASAGKERIIRNHDGTLSRVTEEVYREYHHMRRRERYQQEQKKKNGTISLDAIGYNTNFLCRRQGGRSEIEDALIEKWQLKVLYEELGRLAPWDKRMVGLIYFSGLTIKDTAAALGCSRGKVDAHRKKVFTRIRARFRREGIFHCPV